MCVPYVKQRQPIVACDQVTIPLNPHDMVRSIVQQLKNSFYFYRGVRRIQKDFLISGGNPNGP